MRLPFRLHGSFDVPDRDPNPPDEPEGQEVRTETESTPLEDAACPSCDHNLDLFDTIDLNDDSVQVVCGWCGAQVRAWFTLMVTRMEATEPFRDPDGDWPDADDR